MTIYAATISLSAFLLFQVQPMIAKAILPWFGGSAAVWITCMLFFQAGLLAGYGYAHGIVTRLRPRHQALLHTALLAASLLALPLGPSPAWRPSGGEEPIRQILGLLAVSVGLPYVLLSSTTPLLQAWYARKFQAALPYRLFAWSNGASLLGLLAYPFLIEPRLSLAAQSLAWSVGYAAFAALAGVLALSGAISPRSAARASAPPPGAAPSDLPRPSLTDRLWWVSLSCCGVVLLLSVTYHLTQNVSPTPFLWVLPLGLYLLTFLLCFLGEGLYDRPLYLGPLAIVLLLLMYGTLRYDSTTRIGLVIGVFAGGLFACCMFCHGELNARKPPPSHLTAFYLATALGGALGGLLVGGAAPLVLSRYAEMPLAITACAALLFLAHFRAGWPPRAIAGLVLAAMAAGSGVFLSRHSEETVALARNFYGSLRVTRHLPGSEFETRVLVHGTVAHGVQFAAPERRLRPTAYYGPESGAARLLQERRGRPLRVGLIGLGIGTLAAYAQPGDVYRFYEINPLVEKFAREHFTFLAQAEGFVEVVIGDGRLVLEGEEDQHFDVLVVDAFSGDAIPTHLLTREALQLYFRHLSPAGVLALHLSNHHLDLVPVAEALARDAQKHAVLIENDPVEEEEIFGARWVLVSSTPLVDPGILEAAKAPAARQDLRIWTDDYSNLFTVLK